MCTGSDKISVKGVYCLTEGSTMSVQRFCLKYLVTDEDMNLFHLCAERVHVDACTSFYSQSLFREIPFPLHSVNGLAVHQLLVLKMCGGHYSKNILCVQEHASR